MTKGELARRADLQLPGTIKALERLQSSGMVEAVSSGSRPLVTLRSEHPLAPTLSALFEAEASRVTQLVAEIRRAAQRLSPVPRAVWLTSNLSPGAHSQNESLLVTIVASARELDQAVESLRDTADRLEMAADVDIDLRGLTPADLGMASRQEWDEFGDAEAILGLPPEAFDPQYRDSWELRSKVMHSERDDEAKAYAAKIAEKLESDPSLRERLSARIQERLAEASTGEQLELKEWQRILRTKSTPRLARFLVEDSQRATRLRQTMPFVDLLSPRERKSLLKAADE